MKISAVKTTIQKPIKKVLPYALSAMALVGCTGPIGKIKDYCEEFDKPAVEYIECVNKCNGTCSPKDQAILDSLVYRDLLNGTSLANDSSTISEFNKIAATNSYTRNGYYSADFEANLLKEGITTKEFNYIRSQNKPTRRQFEADKFLYGKLFKEKGLMTKEFNARFRALSLFLDPSTDIAPYNIKHYEKEILERK
ncbi:MAG: hypothetical protein E7Z89_06180 [Cyanobacteria bacterium SIG28]|nr:hypothetical protein [Cyanobacteria bacterium SIG28]